MTDNEFLLYDRIDKIQHVIKQYGEENFYISFSGGKDSTVLSALVDMALPNNKIPRVYADTGIELNMVREFVQELANTDDRVVIIKPSNNIKQTLEEYGYPFKSKAHSETLERYQKKGHSQWTLRYAGIEINEMDKKLKGRFLCPEILKYQFSNDFKLKISDKCCYRMKEEPLHNWQKENNKRYSMLGIMPAEGGRRMGAKCIVFKGKRLSFHPLVVLNKEWEDWFIKEQNVKICDIYKPPYNFDRTGCKGCPFNPNIQKELDTLEKFFPVERKQCELIWRPVYEEYRRLGYRLNDKYKTKKDCAGQINIDDYLVTEFVEKVQSKK